MTYQTQIEDWRAGRLAALKAEDGWLNLTDRIEIEVTALAAQA